MAWRAVETSGDLRQALTATAAEGFREAPSAEGPEAALTAPGPVPHPLRPPERPVRRGGGERRRRGATGAGTAPRRRAASGTGAVPSSSPATTITSDSSTGTWGSPGPTPRPRDPPRVLPSEPRAALRRLAPGRLPSHETAYAATVHKSQGSEAERVLLILPNEASPVMTRELIYTAITRARSRVEIWGTRSVFEAAVARRLTRSSGLRRARCGGQR